MKATKLGQILEQIGLSFSFNVVQMSICANLRRKLVLKINDFFALVARYNHCEHSMLLPERLHNDNCWAST